MRSTVAMPNHITCSHHIVFLFQTIPDMFVYARSSCRMLDYNAWSVNGRIARFYHSAVTHCQYRLIIHHVIDTDMLTDIERAMNDPRLTTQRRIDWICFAVAHSLVIRQSSPIGRVTFSWSARHNKFGLIIDECVWIHFHCQRVTGGIVARILQHDQRPRNQRGLGLFIIIERLKAIVIGTKIEHCLRYWQRECIRDILRLQWRMLHSEHVLIVGHVVDWIRIVSNGGLVPYFQIMLIHVGDQYIQP
mmetsp:Transcript_27465/g.43468  ORF Transcript_27465/g.43468 Transcript_27465/m.43468 type:complete len:247 (+) Transcript_27465:3-743(+)